MKKLSFHIKRSVLVALISVSTFISAYGWGRTGHDAVSYIAECHLTPAAKANIEKYLNGESIVYDSSWLDLVRDFPEYHYTWRSHMYPVGPDRKYHSHPDGDAVTLINQQYSLLKDYKNLSDSAVNVGIKMLVHVIGDLHCPSHPDFDDIYQWYDFHFNGKKLNYHGFWDSYAIETSHKWSYIEYQHQLDRCSPEQIAEICKGTPEDWANETVRNIGMTYAWIQPDMKLSKVEANELILKSARLADRQIMLAGYRLSHILNSIFDPEYSL